MTVSITTGFAKRKRYVGGIYACDGSDLPATQDFGTIQYQGPSLTALTVPATTVTYTIIGKANCGNSVKDIRRITTKTYTSRGPTPSEGGGKYSTTGPDGLTTISAETPLALWNLWYSLISNTTGYFNICPAYTGSFVTYVYNDAPLISAPDINGNVTIKYTTLSSSVSGITISCNQVEARVSEFPVSYAVNFYGFLATASDAYYIDVHEVWTFDLV